MNDDFRGEARASHGCGFTDDEIVGMFSLLNYRLTTRIAAASQSLQTQPKRLAEAVGVFRGVAAG